MKPNFALTLSFDGIGLLHRTQVGWHLVGDVPLDDANLAATLAGLASKARALDPTGLHCKVVIPNEQMKYLSFETESRDVDIIEAQVRNALDSATPYPLAELAYDWSMQDGEVYVAAVAIETLTEAESFAVDHSFGPMCFVAIPEAGHFQGEPFLGETVHAGQVLGADEAVTRDEEAIRIVGAATLPELEEVVESEPEVAQTDDASEDAEQGTDVEPAVQDTIETQADADLETSEDASAPISFSSARRGPETDLGTEPKADIPPAPPLPVEPTEAELPKARFAPADPDDQSEDTSQSDAPQERATPKDPPLSLTDPTEPPLSTSAVELARTLQGSQAPETAPVRPTPKTAEPASKHPGKASFMSRRRGEAAEAGSAKKPSLPRKEALSGINLGLAGRFKKAKSAVSRASGQTKEAVKQAAARTKTEAPQNRTQSYADERQRMTVFGARNPDNVAHDGTRYVALYLTAALLLILVGIAAWAALFLDDGISGLFKRSEEVQFAQEAPEAPAPEAEVVLTPEPAPAPAPEPAPSLSDDTPIEQAAVAPTEPEALADAPLQQPPLPNEPRLSEVLSPDEARARYAATGIWQLAPEPSLTPGITAMEDFYQVSLDPDVAFGDAIALPNSQAFLNETRPATPADPLPPGEDLDRDPRGFVAATPEGVVTPEGFTLFAGAPPLKPPSYPERAEVTPPSQNQTADGEATYTLRPRARPESLLDAFERENNGGLTLAELSEIRPKLRPRSAQEIALAAAGVSTEIEDGADPSEEAVLVSLKPKLRPQAFARIAEEARQTAAAEPVSVEQQVSVSIPTTASVARAATERNQISLRKLNLIGVYGQANSRRALVRLSNGRYKKVEVGDRLDGGEVAAIDKDELLYIKRGKSLVLKMPKG